MIIISAKYSEYGDILVEFSRPDIEGIPQSNITRTVPNDLSNMDRVDVAEWVAAGGVIAPYVAPPLTAGEIRTVELKALPETIDLEDKLKNATPAQIRSYLAANATTVFQLREIVARMLIYMATRL